MSEETPEARPRVWKTPPNVPLCAEADVPDPGARSLVLQIGEAFFHGFVVRKDGQVAGYVDRCPHAGHPLALELDRWKVPDCRKRRSLDWRLISISPISSRNKVPSAAR